MNTLCATLVVGILAGSAGGRSRRPGAGPRAREPDLTRLVRSGRTAQTRVQRPGPRNHQVAFSTSLFSDPARPRRSTERPERRALQPVGASWRSDAHGCGNGAGQRGQTRTSRAARNRTGSARRPCSRTTAVSTASTSPGSTGSTGARSSTSRCLLPSEDETAKLWYVAAAAFMANRSLLADLSPHPRKAGSSFRQIQTSCS